MSGKTKVITHEVRPMRLDALLPLLFIVATGPAIAAGPDASLKRGKKSTFGNIFLPCYWENGGSQS